MLEGDGRVSCSNEQWEDGSRSMSELGVVVFSVIPALGRGRQEDQKLKASLSYIAGLRLA